MKTKLTLTINHKLIHQGKKWAKKRNTSLSRLIEKYLEKTTAKKSDFVQKWKGKFHLRKQNDPRGKYLSEKYQ